MKKTILSGLICTLMLSACVDNTKNAPDNINQNVATASSNANKTESSASSAVSASNTALEDELANVEILPEVKAVLLNEIKEAIESGKLKKEDINEEEIVLMGKALTKSFLDAQKQSFNNDANSVLSETNPTIEKLQQNFGIVKYTQKDIINKHDSYVGVGAKEVGEKIKNNIKDVKINEIRTLSNPNFFIVYVNDSPMPMYTDTTADFFIIERQYFGNVDYNKSVNSLKAQMLNYLFDKTGKPIPHYVKNSEGQYVENQKETSQVYQKIMNSVKKSVTIKKVFGKGERELFVFTDPDCPFCLEQDRDLLSNLKASDNVTIYYVLNPIDELHPDATNKAAKIACSSNPSETWEKWQLTRELSEPQNYNEETCKKDVAKQSVVPYLLGLHVTPTNITNNGIMMMGRLDSNTVRELLPLKFN